MSAPILVAGEALYDLVAGGDGAVIGHPGGGPFNTARTIGRLRQPVAYLGRLSTDRLGETHERRLAADGVDLSCVLRTTDPTTLALASLDVRGTASYNFYSAGTAAPGLTVEHAVAMIPPAVAALHVGSLGFVLEPLASALEAVVERFADHTLVMIDPNCRPGVIDDEESYRARLDRLVSVADGHQGQRRGSRLARSGPPAGTGGEGAAGLRAGSRAAHPGFQRSHAADGARRRSDRAGPNRSRRHDRRRRRVLRSLPCVVELTRLRTRRLGSDELLIAAVQFASLIAARTVARAGASPPVLAAGVAETAALELTSFDGGWHYEEALGRHGVGARGPGEIVCSSPEHDGCCLSQDTATDDDLDRLRPPSLVDIGATEGDPPPA